MGETPLESYITQTSVSIRFAYERIQDTFPKLCNLVGTSNEHAFLKDMTGNRRFPIIETDCIDQDQYNAIDKYELWKEAYFLYLAYPDTCFDHADFQAINERAEEYVKQTPEQELLLKFYDEADPETGTFHTVTEMLSMLMGSSNIKTMNISNLGKAIAALKWKKTFQGRDKSKRFGYWVQERVLAPAG